MTHDALRGSLLRYAPAVAGSCLLPDLSQKIDTRLVDSAARKILGVDRTARVETLHFVAGAYNFRNMGVVRLAEHLDLIMRSHDSTAKTEATSSLCDNYGVNNLHIRTAKILFPVEQIINQETNKTTRRIWGKTEWQSEEFSDNWSDSRIKQGISMYVNYSKEVRTPIRRREGTYQFENTAFWLDGALQVLKYVNWSPECSQAWKINAKKPLPPRIEARKILPGIFQEGLKEWNIKGYLLDKKKEKRCLRTL